MLKRNIYYLLLILVVIVSCVVPPFVQSSTVHATTNQEQANEIKYINKNLGFSLRIPESWKDKFLIREDSNSISFVFRYNNQTYEDIRFFTIGYGKAQEEGWEKELRGVRTLGKKGSMMYSSYNPFSLSDYNEFIPDQATRDIALSMSEQIDAVLDSFQMIKSTGEPVNSGKNKEVIYTNDTHKFSLVLPENWKGKYSIDEFVEDIDAHTTKIEFYFTRKTDGYREPIFMIYKYDQKLYNSNAEGENSIPAHILAKENGKIYEIVVNNALQNYDRYAELFPNATKEEHKILATMNKQIKDISRSFKIIEGSTAEEAKPKEQGKKGGTAEEETNQETDNGIKYINGELGFELTLPKFWKNHYIVEENDSGGVTFKFKFDGKVYDDIYLFNIYVENREYSKEEQETMGDIGVLDVKNGKTYLIAENLAMYASPQAFDKYFSSVPKEGRNVIKAMSKQKKILHFKVLEGAVAEEAKKGEVSNEQPPAEEKEKEEVSYEEFCSQFGDGDFGNMCNNFLVFRDFIGERIDPIAKQSRNNADRILAKQKFSEQSDYSFYIEPRSSFYRVRYYIIKTPIDNIRTEVIRKRVSKTNYTGVNGGFLKLKYDEETKKIFKMESRNISYYSGAIDGLTNGLTDGSTENYEYNGTRGNPYSWPTFVTYYDKDLRKTKAEIIHDTTSMDEIKNKHFKNRPNHVIINAIGGKSYEKDHWGNSEFGKETSYSYKPARRTVLGYKEEEGTVYAYLMVTDSDTTVENLKEDVKKLGFNKDNSIVLDGSGSTSMRVKMPNGKWFIDKGKEPIFLAPINDADRPVYNMIRLINDTPR